MTGLPASTSGVDPIVANAPLRTLVLTGAIAAADVRRERLAAQSRDDRPDGPSAADRSKSAALRERVGAGNVEVVAPIETARPFVRRRVVRIVRLREVVSAAGVVRVV